MDADPEFGAVLETLIPGTRANLESGLNPPGWVWHHAVSDQTQGVLGVMRLVPERSAE